MRTESTLGSHRTILILNAVTIVVFALAAPGFASVPNLVGVVVAALPLLLLATGQTFVLVAAGIDLSSTAVVGLVSVAGGLTMSGDGGWLGGHPFAVPAGMVVMLATGALVGAVNGVSVGWLRMPAFMVTLTVGMCAGGLAVWLARTAAGTETIFNLPRGFVTIGATTATAAALTGVSALAGHGLLTRTVFGRWVRAVGDNPRAALVSGVPVARVIAAAYLTSGVCAALAAILLTGSLETASPAHARQLLLDVIGATVIGGTSLSGGRGDLRGTALGVAFLALVGNGLTLVNLSDFVITIVKGVVILVAALIDGEKQ